MTMFVLAEAAGASPLDEHQVLVFLVQLSLLVGVARLFGGVMKILKQPPVVGELMAGIVLGPTIFGRVAPGSFDWVFGEPVVASAVFGLAWLGVILLLVVIGFETDLAIISRFKAAAAAVSVGGLLVPFAVAVAVAFYVPDNFIAEGTERGLFAGFFALALSVSALPVVAKILQDLGFLRRNFGQITLAAGMTMDSVGWLVLAGLVGVARDGFQPEELALSFGGLVVFVVFIATAGRWMVDRMMRAVMDHGSSVTAALTISLVAALIAGTVTQALHVEAILGAFVGGIMLATVRHQIPQVRRILEDFTTAFFAPIFFAFSGLRVDLGLLNSWSAVLWTAAIILLAIAAKIGGTVVFGRLGGVTGREALALGSGLSALGAMGIVVAIFALTLGIVSTTGYTVMVLVAIATSIISPLLLKWVVSGWEIPEEEQVRLDREQLLASSEILSSRRVLLPTRGGASSRYAAEVIAGVFDDAEVTVMTVDVVTRRFGRALQRGGSAAAPDDVLAALEGMEIRKVHKSARSVVDAIAREAQLEYDLVLIGGSEPGGAGAGLFSSVVEKLLASLDIPAIVVQFPGDRQDETFPLPQRVLVPVVASRGTRAAEEFAYSLVKRTGGRVTALHVVNRPDGQGMMLEEAAIADAMRIGQEMVAVAAAFGERLGVEVDTAVRLAPHPQAEVVAVANSGIYDLVILGAAHKPFSDRPFFGHRVTYMVENATIPTVIVALPNTEGGNGSN